MYVEILRLILDPNDRTTGGGAASALCGAMAAGMAAMVAKLSGEKPVNLSQARYQEMIVELEALKEELLAGAADDRKAYLGLKGAFSLPKGSDEEKEIRSRAIRDAAYHAAAVPLANGERDKKVYQIVCELEGNSNPSCISDLMSARYLSISGIMGCALNIEANLPLVKNEGRAKELTEAMHRLTENVTFE